jgi:hypothetical protein
MVSGENLFPLLSGAVTMGRGPVIPDRRRWRRAFFAALNPRLRFCPQTHVIAIVPVGPWLSIRDRQHLLRAAG